MQDLIILGTGVHGGEMAHIVERINRVQPVWKLLGHITGKAAAQKEFAGYPVLGTIDALSQYPQTAIVADNEFPKDIAIPEERLVTLIDPSSYVHPTAQIGRGCVIYPGCFIGLQAVIGDRVFMLSGCIVNHDDKVEDRVVFASGVSLAGSVHVEEGVYLGQASTVRQFLRIGKNSLVGMGTVVVRDVPPKIVVVGNPARKLKDK